MSDKPQTRGPMVTPASARIDLTVTGGDGDAERTGYWMVTGPQDPLNAYGIIERTRILTGPWDHPDQGDEVVFLWYLHRRTEPDYRDSPVTRVDQVANGKGATLEEALEELHEAWLQHLGTKA